MPAVSKRQRHIFGWALACKRGESNYCPKRIKKLSDTMSIKKLRDFAKTKEKNLPQHVTERHIMSYEEFVNEALRQKEEKHSFGCVMLTVNVDKKLWDKIQDVILEEDLYTEIDEDDPEIIKYGREDWPHCTVLYGLKSEEIEDSDLKETLSEYVAPKVKLKKVTCFKNDKYDVVKFDVKATDSLYDMNKKLEEDFPFESNYPDYLPHVTIAYVKPGKGDNYAEKIMDLLEKKIKVICPEIVYSKPDGDRISFNLEIEEESDDKDDE
jgi:2'-5' RNA ligase